MYRPQEKFNVAMKILKPEWVLISGVDKKRFPTINEVSDELTFFGSFRTFGGTERDVNGIYSIEDTATIETWYRPEITAECRIALLETNEVYEIIGTPENISKRNQFLKFKVRKIKGKA